jgi:RNA polymerase sigma-70 factor (ECF subfamily)
MEAAEAAQETFVRAYFALGKLKRPEAFLSWLLGIADRVAKEAVRASKRRRRDVPLLGDVAETAPEHDDSASRQVSLAVAGLPELYRDVVLLRYYAGMSCAEISRHQDVPLGTVTKRLSRAYALLRESLRSPTGPQDVEVSS